MLQVSILVVSTPCSRFEFLFSFCFPKKVIHRDIKPPNILIDQNMEPRVADFGLAKEINTDVATHLSTAVSGTIGYLAPEYASEGRLTTKSDVYAFGVVVLEVRPLKSSKESCAHIFSHSSVHNDHYFLRHLRITPPILSTIAFDLAYTRARNGKYWICETSRK